MKNKKKDLEVDFIGGQDSLTKEEEKAISDFFKQKKEIKSKTSMTSKRIAKKKATV